MEVPPSNVIDLDARRKKTQAEKELLEMQQLSHDIDHLISERVKGWLGAKPSIGQIEPRLVAVILADRIGNLMAVGVTHMGLDKNRALAA